MADQQQRYRVIDRLASGGMAEVFIAESAGIEGFKKKVAIKRVLPHLSEKKRFIAMFLDEARLSAHLSHSNVVQVFDIGVGDKTYFIVMEYVNGADLKQVIKHVRDSGKSFPIEAAIYMCAKMCEGLAYAHECRGEEGELLHVVHRDISPPNVLISEHGEIKIVDFGLAKASTQLEKSEAGIIKGKFSYLAPEAAHGNEVDARADIFAVGIILWEMLAGRRLFQGKSDYETVKQVQAAKIPPITQLSRDADDHLQSILARALAQNRENRYGSARALGSDLTRYLYKLGRPVSSFDIAELVRGAMLQRKQKGAGEGISIIDKLIQETLFEFTSLQDKEAGPQVGGDRMSTVEPFSLASFEDFADWSDQKSKGPARSEQANLLLRNTLTAEVFEEGNLAALEGPDEPAVRPKVTARGSTPEISMRESLVDANDLPSDGLLPLRGGGAVSSRVPDVPVPGVHAGGSRPSHGRISGPPSSHGLVAVDSTPPEAKTSTAVKAILLFVIAAGTAAAVWFSGLL
jgi:eukaryotic-like serine/threonine-protein kinase